MNLVHSLDAREVERIYLDAFPASERIPVPQLQASLRDGSRTLLVARDGEECAGFAVFYELIPGVVYLEYLAVDAARRSGGIGSLLLHNVRDRAADGVIFEVEDPDADVCPAQRAERLRRMAFYERHGAEKFVSLGVYRTPDATGGPPLAMRLCWLGPMMSREQLRSCAESLMRREYGLDVGDPLFAANIAALGC